VSGEKLAYGVSITDGCIGSEGTESLLREAAGAIGRARSRDPAAPLLASLERPG
jgi:3-deoxy-D-arabino-heptulosonate 7-phosphate (DAHP) synthase